MPKRKKKNITSSEAGKMGAKKRNKNLSAERRSEIARLAVQARWNRCKCGHLEDEHESFTHGTKGSGVVSIPPIRYINGCKAEGCACKMYERAQ